MANIIPLFCASICLAYSMEIEIYFVLFTQIARGRASSVCATLPTTIARFSRFAQRVRLVWFVTWIAYGSADSINLAYNTDAKTAMWWNSYFIRSIRAYPKRCQMKCLRTSFESRCSLHVFDSQENDLISERRIWHVALHFALLLLVHLSRNRFSHAPVSSRL